MTLVLLARTESAIVDRQIEVSASYRDEIAAHLLDWIEERRDDILLLSRIVPFDSGGRLDEAAARELLALFVEALPVFDEALLVGPDGRILAGRAVRGGAERAGADKGVDPVAPDASDPSLGEAIAKARAEALLGKAFLSDIFAGQDGGPALILFSAPVSRGRAIAGFVAGLLKVEDLARLVDEAGLKDLGSAYLVDMDGRLVSNPGFAGKFRESGREGSRAGFDTRAARDLAAGREGSAEYISYDGTAVIGAYRRIAPLGLGLVVELSRERALRPVASILEFALLFSVLLLLLLFAASAYLSARLIAPIGALIEGAESLIKDSFGPPIAVRTGTELDQLVGIFNRLAETLREREAGLRESAARDSLTGLYNHGRLEEFLAIEIKRRSRAGEAIAFVMIDIDHFKPVNDRHGHQAGDEVLRGVALILGECVRGGDVLGRYGGEEFGVILDARNDEEAEVFCERIRARVEETSFAARGLELRVTVSLGWTRAQAEGCEPYDIVSRADRALYEAKNAGRNRVRGFGTSPEALQRCQNP
jgi:diguanylate cyclase (GGDEF)-like protein